MIIKENKKRVENKKRITRNNLKKTNHFAHWLLYTCPPPMGGEKLKSSGFGALTVVCSCQGTSARLANVQNTVREQTRCS